MKYPKLPSQAEKNLNKKVNRLSVCLCLIFVTFAAMSLMAYADPASDIVDGVSGGMESVWGVLRALSVPCGIVAFAVAGFRAFTGGEQGMRDAKKIALIAIAGLAFILFAPVVIHEAFGWFDQENANSMFKI